MATTAVSQTDIPAKADGARIRTPVAAAAPRIPTAAATTMAESNAARAAHLAELTKYVIPCSRPSVVALTRMTRSDWATAYCPHPAGPSILARTIVVATPATVTATRLVAPITT